LELEIGTVVLNFQSQVLYHAEHLGDFWADFNQFTGLYPKPETHYDMNIVNRDHVNIIQNLCPNCDYIFRVLINFQDPGHK
jgi:hypothetical protein